ncbi:MAG: hypothetical protein HY909_18265 [Deltaproteobacteria bacterium]|nr:hypothetical protein [Deltaproteobacteria bacterium]
MTETIFDNISFLALVRAHLSNAMEAVNGVCREDLEEMLASGSWRWSEHNGLEWRGRGPDGRPVFRFTGRLREP